MKTRKRYIAKESVVKNTHKGKRISDTIGYVPNNAQREKDYQSIYGTPAPKKVVVKVEPVKTEIVVPKKSKWGKDEDDDESESEIAGSPIGENQYAGRSEIKKHT